MAHWGTASCEFVKIEKHKIYTDNRLFLWDVLRMPKIVLCYSLWPLTDQSSQISIWMVKIIRLIGLDYKTDGTNTFIKYSKDTDYNHNNKNQEIVYFKYGWTHNDVKLGRLIILKLGEL